MEIDAINLPSKESRNILPKIQSSITTKTIATMTVTTVAIEPENIINLLSKPKDLIGIEISSIYNFHN